MITVKVIRVPGAVIEVGLEDNASIADALSAANVTPASGEMLNLNGDNTTDTSTQLEDGDRVILAKGAKAN